MLAAGLYKQFRFTADHANTGFDAIANPDAPLAAGSIES